MTQHLNYQDDQAIKAQQRQFRLRLWIAFGFVVLCFGLLTGRMFYLQVLQYNHFHAMAEGNRIAVEVIPPVRGKIYDRNHVLLADNQPTYTLKFTRERHTDIEALIETLHQLLPEVSDTKLEKFRRKMHHTRSYASVLAPFNLTEKQAAKIAVNSYKLPTIVLAAHLKRIYPYQSTAVHAIGYVGRINVKELKSLDEERYRGTDSIGKAGIEKYYEDLLHGSPGLQYVETNARGRVIRKLDSIPATPGQNIQLTLDIELQQYAESLLAGKKGAIVVMNPNNGEVLAYVSQPVYDPNLFVEGISHKAYQQLRLDKHKPFINRPINGQYPPGSTVKPFVALGALEHKLISPTHKIWDPGYLEFSGHRYRDWKHYGHGLVDMDAAITQSCDTYFYELGLKMGVDMIHDTLYPFGFGHPTGIDLPSESSGILPSQNWKRETRNKPWYRGETVIAAIGQGYMLATPLQLAKAVSILANHGQIIKPHLKLSTSGHPIDPIEKEIEEEKSSTKAPEPTQIPIKDIRNWDRVIKAMTHVMHNPRGTAYRYARHLPFNMAGKTGTAQVFSLKDAEYDAESIKASLRDHSLFIGFAPVKSPQIAISVLVENSSIKAAPLAVKIANYYLTRQKSTTLPQPSKPAR